MQLIDDEIEITVFVVSGYAKVFRRRVVFLQRLSRRCRRGGVDSRLNMYKISLNGGRPREATATTRPHRTHVVRYLCAIATRESK